MRKWPASIKFTLTRLSDRDPKSVDSGGEFIVEHLEVHVEALCADAVMRKVKDHYLKLYPEAGFKFGPVVWYPSEMVGQIVLSF
jgi:hypothetical protein